MFWFKFEYLVVILVVDFVNIRTFISYLFLLFVVFC